MGNDGWIPQGWWVGLGGRSLVHGWERWLLYCDITKSCFLIQKYFWLGLFPDSTLNTWQLNTDFAISPQKPGGAKHLSLWPVWFKAGSSHFIPVQEHEKWHKSLCDSNSHRFILSSVRFAGKLIQFVRWYYGCRPSCCQQSSLRISGAVAITALTDQSPLPPPRVKQSFHWQSTTGSAGVRGQGDGPCYSSGNAQTTEWQMGETAELCQDLNYYQIRNTWPDLLTLWVCKWYHLQNMTQLLKFVYHLLRAIKYNIMSDDSQTSAS